MSLKTESILISVMFFMLILTTGGLLHVVYGGILSPLFYLLLVVIILANKKKYNVKLLKRTILIQLGLILIVNLNFVIVPFSNDYWSYVKLLLRLLSTHLFLVFLINNKHNLTDLLYKSLKIVSWLAIINFLFAPILHPFTISVSGEAVDVDTLGFLFNYKSFVTIAGIDIFRNQGIFWEPGILQIFMNIMFFMALFVTRSNLYRWISAFLIITTFSTTGLVLLIIQLIVFYKKIILKASIFLKFIILAIVLPGLCFFAYQNVQEKISGGGVASFDLRFFDLLTAFNYIKNFPLSGIGLDSHVYIDQQAKFLMANMPDFTFDVYFTVGQRGNTNSVLMLFVSVGIPFAVLCLYKLYKQTIIPNHIFLFFTILIISNMSEPLFMGNFFMLFFLSSFHKNDLNYVLTTYLNHPPKQILPI